MDDAWVLWIIAALVLGIAEVFTGGALVFGMLAVGSVAAGLVMLLTGNAVLSWVVFGVVSGATILVVRPIARSHMQTPAALRSGAAALIGADAVVLQSVDGHDGRIKLKGEVWSARAYDGQSEYPAGETVQVLQIDGATALVA